MLKKRIEPQKKKKNSTEKVKTRISPGYIHLAQVNST